VLDRDTGVFAWTASNPPATHRFTIWVSQWSAPYLSDSKVFSIVTEAALKTLRFTGLRRDTTGAVTVTWEAVSGARYQLQYKPRLDAPQWLAVGDLVTAITDQVTQTDPDATGEQRYYRVLRVE